MISLWRASLLLVFVLTQNLLAQEMEIHEEGVVTAEMPPYESHFYDPYFNLDPTSSGTGGTTNPIDTGGSGNGGASSDDIFEEQCGTSDAYLEAKILSMTGGGFSITNPERGRWGNTLNLQAKIHNIGSSKINSFSLKFVGPGGTNLIVAGSYPEINYEFETDSSISTDGIGQLTAIGQVECMNVTKNLTGNAGSDKKSVLMFHSGLRYTKTQEFTNWGGIQSVYVKDYCSTLERKFSHSYSIEVSYESGFELSPLVSSSLGLSQSYSYSEETVLKLDKFDAIHAYYQNYEKTVYIDAYRYQANGTPGGREDSTTYVEKGKKFKVDYNKLEICQ